jgi:hypothetical protein
VAFGGFGVTPGGRAVALELGGHSIFPDGDLGIILTGTDTRPNENDPIGYERGFSIQRISPTGDVDWSHWLATSRSSEFDELVTPGGVVVDADGNVYATGSFAGCLAVGTDGVQSVVNPGSRIEPLDGRGRPSPDAFFLKLDRGGNVIWLKSFGGVADQRPTALLEDAAGNLVMLITFRGRFDIDGQTFLSSGGSTESNGVLATFDSDGTLLSARQVTEGYGTYLARMDSEENFILASPEGWVAKRDPSWELVWLETFDDVEGPSPRAIAVDLEDNIVIAADAYGDPSLYGQPLVDQGAVLIKLSPDGEPLFAAAYGSNHLDATSAVAILSDNSIAITGSFHDSIDFGAGLLTALEPGANRSDVFVAKLDENGGHLMSLHAGGIDADAGYGIAALPGDELVTAGYFTAAIDFGGGQVANRGGPYVAWLPR